ncbi:MAG: extracellular solute-binding protein [Clostridia bacterium]|nr:extracellular solute-binding protein [Clostridia bacterium]
MYKKLLVLLLCGVMLISIFAGCANSGSEQESSEKKEEESSWISGDLDLSVDMDGKEVVILTLREVDVGPEENSSDPLEDAVYRRNDMLQTQLGVELNTILNEDYSNLGETVKTDVSAGTGEYHIVYQHMVDAASNLALNDYLYNLTDLEYVDFDQPWWDQDCKNGFMIGDNMMVVCGDLLPSTMLITATVVFNKDLFDERGWDYPYQDARDGTWTLDDMLTLTKEQTKDLSGDGKINYQDDFYGLVGWSLDCDYNFFFGSGCTMFTFDDDHLPVYDVNADRLQTVYDKVYQLIVTQQSFHVTVAQYLADNSMFQQPDNVFKSGRALFFATDLNKCVALKDMEDNYGMLPHPKYDEKQAEYLSFVNGAASMVIVPKSLSDDKLAVSGYMMEALASSSYYMVTDTLYEKIAKSKTARDPESAEMVDVIIRNKVFDFGYSHFHSKGLPCASIFQTALNAEQASIVRNITSGQKSTVKELKKVYAAYGYEY